MPAFIEISNKEARFAFNGQNGDPWHKMGTSVDGYGTVDEMLVAAKAKWDVDKQPLFINGPNGPIKVEDKVATVRNEYILDSDGVSQIATPLGVVGSNYAVEQNISAAEWALDLVGASQGDAVIDTMGVLRDGKEFFVGVDLGTLVLDPDGIADAIKKYLVVRNGHDGLLALCAYPTNTRVVCWNTATWSYQEAKRTQQVHRVRHTSGKDNRKAEAVEAMGLARKIGEMFAEQAMRMMTIDGGIKTLTRVADTLWPLQDDASDRMKQAWADRRSTLIDIYESPTCAANFGDSGWTVWNAITEYLDHHRPRSNASKRALATMDLDGPVAKMKDAAAHRILSMA